MLGVPCAVVGGAAIVGFLIGVHLVLLVLAESDETMSGVGVIAGLVLAVVATLVLPGAAPPGLRAKAYGISW